MNRETQRGAIKAEHHKFNIIPTLGKKDNKYPKNPTLTRKNEERRKKRQQTGYGHHQQLNNLMKAAQADRSRSTATLPCPALPNSTHQPAH
ncbi:hypothetical protein E2C01_066546 [Portunus trituberculatus]|uniref:Uncharacterized protein n=1 Tax=Portunus trituberculatus TaxID=210409 RepID=A0A5B7HU43_PORTR|nr:hypothetical protein [Portunus trituberculatus]